MISVNKDVVVNLLLILATLTDCCSAVFLITIQPTTPEIRADYMDKWYFDSKWCPTSLINQLFVETDTFVNDSSMDGHATWFYCLLKNGREYRNHTIALKYAGSAKISGLPFFSYMMDHPHFDSSLEQNSISFKAVLEKIFTITDKQLLTAKFGESAQIQSRDQYQHAIAQVKLQSNSLETSCEPFWVRAVNLIREFNDTVRTKLTNVHKIQWNIAQTSARYTCIEGYTSGRESMDICKQIETNKPLLMSTTIDKCSNHSHRLPTEEFETFLSATVSAGFDLPDDLDYRQLILNEFLATGNRTCDNVLVITDPNFMSKPGKNDYYLVIMTTRRTNTIFSGLTDQQLCIQIEKRIGNDEIVCLGPFDIPGDGEIKTFQLYVWKRLTDFTRPRGVHFPLALLHHISTHLHANLSGCQFSLRFDRGKR